MSSFFCRSVWATSISVPYSISRISRDIFSIERESTFLSPDRVETELSSSLVTRSWTSSGPAPG